MQFAFKYLIGVFLFSIFSVGFAQHEFGSTQEMEAAAAIYYSNQEYTEAFPIYSQMLSLDRTNPLLNYRFGVCLLYSDRSDTYAPIEYLKKGLENIDDVDVYFHLGFAYHINYNFPAAISYYEKYKSIAGKKVNKRFEVERKIEMCQNGMLMMKSVRDLFVLQKSEVARKDFFRSYELRDFGGRIIKKPENFASKEDIKLNSNDFMFFNSKSPVVYYSAYGKDGKAQKDIYSRAKNEDGTWADAVKLPETINTPYDDDFPVMMPDGKTLYFSSNGHNTMGGFDIFKSVYDSKTKKWSTPENINFPFNTPVDDILFISDTSETSAWFASVRNSVNDKIMVYKVGILKRPEGSEDLASIYSKNQQLTDADLKKIKDKARLDVNISEDEFEEIPVKPDLASTSSSQNFEKGEDMIARKLSQNKLQDALLDSVRQLIDYYASEIQQEDSVRQIALNLSIKNTRESELYNSEAKNAIKLTGFSDKTTELNTLVNTANKALAKSEKSAYMARQQSDFADELKTSISEKNNQLSNLNQLYGNAQHAMISGNFEEAKSIIAGIKIPANEAKNKALFAEIPFDSPEKESQSLPLQYANFDQFAPFEVSMETGSPVVVAISQEYKEFLPEVNQTSSASNTTEMVFSNNPSKRVDEYIDAIRDKISSDELILNDLRGEIETIKSKWNSIPLAEKSTEVKRLNNLQNNYYQLSSQIEWASEQVFMAETEYKKQLLSAAAPEAKMVTYKNLAGDLESIFNFSSNSFLDKNPKTANSVVYVIDNKGLLAELDSGENGTPDSQQLSFNESNIEQISEKSTQMLADVRNSEKKKDFLVKKIEKNLADTEVNLKNTLIEANTLLESAKNANNSTKQNQLDLANKKFAAALKLSGEIESYKEVLKEIQSSTPQNENIMNSMNSQVQTLSQNLTQKNWEQAEQAFRNQENSLKQYKEINKSTLLVDGETGLLIPNLLTELPSEKVYKLQSNGNIAKALGNPNTKWNSSDDIIRDTKTSDVVQTLVLSPNTELSNKIPQFSNSFSPVLNPQNPGVVFDAPKVPANVLNSSNSLVKSTLLQVDNLQNEIIKLSDKRNSLQNFYNTQMAEAEKFEQQSVQILQSASISNESVETANMLSRQSKQSLVKAAVASQIIKEIDNKILQNSNALQESISTSTRILTLINNNESDEALLVNVQLQRKNASLDNKVNDAAFNYILQEIAVPNTDIINLRENNEFLVVDGQIQRNDQASLLKFLHDLSPAQRINVDASDYISWGPESANVGLSQQSGTNTSGQNSVASSENIENQSSENDISQIVQSYNTRNFNNENDIRNALSQLNFAAQTHWGSVNRITYDLTLLAEQKLKKSNEFSLKAESENVLPREKKVFQDSSTFYLNQALALKQLTEKYNDYATLEEDKKKKITQSSFEIEKTLSIGQLDQSKAIFTQMQKDVGGFSAPPANILKQMQSEISTSSANFVAQMDSMYLQSQNLANQSVMLLSQAGEERKKAEGKRNAFKRREMIKKAEDLEIKATQLQNESEKALAQGNTLYQSSQVTNALATVSGQIENLILNPTPNQTIPVNQAIVFEEIDERKRQVYSEQFDIVGGQLPVEENEKSNNEKSDLRAYERENFKAEMLTEELELIKREIVLLTQPNNASLSDKEKYLNTQNVKLLRLRADSLEYQAQIAFNLANSLLESLSVDEQKAARKNSRDFNAYLQDLKSQIEKLLSEASALKQRAERTNNLENRNALINQASEKEEIAMYLILEEFEVIAQKNKTRYRKNQLILQQLIIEKASLQERELMLAIFQQIDDYFDQAQQKRMKANEAGISFTMKKILLQDAYSLEMKALDLQQQAQGMLEKHETELMLSFQPKVDVINEIAQTTNSTVPINQNTQNEANNISAQNENSSTIKPLNEEIPFIAPTKSGVVYKVQFSAIRELKSADFFKKVPEITAERVANSNFIRYFSGEFSEIDAAIIRRNNLRSNGYPDAFIRSWKNGETINLLAAQAGTEANKAASTVPMSNSVETVINNVDFSANNITSLQGTYFTVQIGVYTRPRTSNAILGISPLYHKRLNNGYWVYYSGIYKSIEDATGRKDEIVAKGVSDAFVVAFTDGKAVSIYNALDNIERGGAIPSDEDIVILEDASTRLNSDWNIAQNTSPTTPTTSSSATDYKIQIGVYSNPVNLDWIASQLDGSSTIEMTKNANGKYVYTYGNFTTEQSARQQLVKVKEIVGDAFVVGYRDGKKLYF